MQVDFNIGYKQGSHSSITAPTVDDFLFECWVGSVSTVGWVGSAYYSSAKSRTTDVWVAFSQNPVSGKGAARGYALYVPAIP